MKKTRVRRELVEANGADEEGESLSESDGDLRDVTMGGKNGDGIAQREVLSFNLQLGWLSPISAHLRC